MLKMDFKDENDSPTPIPEVNMVLLDLLKDVKRILKGNLVGMYLEGSLANGDFDEDSDIDFVVVTREDVSENIFLALQAMHEQINLLDTQWSVNLEGTYISQAALRRYDPGHAYFPNIERGSGERLKMVSHEETWNIHRYILREHGITLVGPPPKTLIDPVASNQLRQTMEQALNGWATPILDHPEVILHKGYQSYTVLTLCRILYTLEFDDVVSKHKAARWVNETQGETWSALIDQAWIGRHQPQFPASSDMINRTLDLIRYTIDKASTIL